VNHRFLHWCGLSMVSHIFIFKNKDFSLISYSGSRKILPNPTIRCQFVLVDEVFGRSYLTQIEVVPPSFKTSLFIISLFLFGHIPVLDINQLLFQPIFQYKTLPIYYFNIYVIFKY